jgi:DNA-binding CsgD family transcriptional regulator
MWRAVGISGDEERVYRALLRDPELGVGECARALGITPQRCGSAIRGLVAVGLLRGERPVDPRVALGSLIRDRQRELDRLVGDIEQLATDFDHGQLRADPGGLVEIVEGVDAIRARMSDLLSTAQDDIAGLDAPPYVMDSDECEALERLALKRGVRYRCLYGTSALDNAGKLAYISAMEQAGEQPRLVRTVPLKLFVFDRRTAIIPLTGSENGNRFRTIVVHRSALTDALYALFEVLWRQASPWPAETCGSGALTSAEQALLRRLVSGMKDEAIARHLGCSRRTLRRRVEALLDKLGAGSRFQAGALAAQRGWL